MIVFQRANLIVSLAIGATVVAVLAANVPALQFARPLTTATAVITWSAWGWDELRYGDSPARRVFGGLAWLGVLVWLVTR